MQPDPADALDESVRTVVHLLSDARATSVGDLRRRQQSAHVELWTALQKYERATAIREKGDES